MQLKDEINEIREQLNEACCEMDYSCNKKKILELSRNLDELIVMYMKEF